MKNLVSVKSQQCCIFGFCSCMHALSCLANIEWHGSVDCPDMFSLLYSMLRHIIFEAVLTWPQHPAINDFAAIMASLSSCIYADSNLVGTLHCS